MVFLGVKCMARRILCCVLDFLEDLCASEPKYVLELLVSAECLHDKLKFDVARTMW